MPRVSVIIPAHNAESYLAETLGSVESQTFSDWEVVVADDASSDGTLALARRFGPRVKAVHSSENLGPAGARNLALEHASGELVALLDADDLWAPEYLERMVGAYDAARARGDRIGIVTCNARVLAGDEYAPFTYHDLFELPADVTLERVLEQNPIYVSSLVPRAVMGEAGPFATETWGSEDHDMWIRIMELGYRVLVLRETLAVYRRREGSVSSDLASMGRTNQTTYRLALARGRLTPRQRRIAQRYLRYNRAMEEVAAFASSPREERRRAGCRLARSLPLLVRVVSTHPGRWGQWYHALRHPGEPIR